MTVEQKDYPTEARGNPAAAVEEAKAAAKAEGRRIRTVARIRSRSGDRYIVTLALDVP